MSITNPFGVSVKPLNYNAPGAPTTKTYHGAAIWVNGMPVGRITSWQVDAYNRTTTLVREISNTTWGRPVDIVPGISDGYKITFDRAEVWSQELEIAFGLTGQVFDDLADQDKPFEVIEYLYKGATPYMLWQYQGCWLSSRNESARKADGDGIISIESGTINYVSRRRIAGFGI